MVELAATLFVIIVVIAALPLILAVAYVAVLLGAAAFTLASVLGVFGPEMEAVGFVIMFIAAITWVVVKSYKSATE